MDELVSEENVIVIVAILRRSASHCTVRKHLEELVVQPLTEGRVLSCEFYDLLGDDSSPEGADGGDLGLSEVGYIVNQFFINTFDLEVLAFDFHLLTEVFLDDGLKLGCVLTVEGSRDAVVLGEEGVERVENDVELLRNSEFLPAGDGHLARVGRIGVAQTLLEVEEALLEGHLDLGGDSSSGVVAEAASVPDEEAVGRLHLDLEGEAVDLGHALDFSEGDCISIIESVLLLLVQTDESAFLLSDASDVHSLALFASSVKDAVGLSKIDKGVSVESEVTCEDESVPLCMYSFVECNEVFAIVAVNDNHALVVGGAG